MYLNRTHIYDFIKQKWLLKKKDVAKKLNYSQGQLSPSRPYDEERLYENVFKMSTLEKEVDILNELKEFLQREKVENNLTSLQNMGYENFVKEILRRANKSVMF